MRAEARRAAKKADETAAPRADLRSRFDPDRKLQPRSGSFSWSAAGPLARALDERIGGRQLLEPGDRIILALSGGLDSVALLHLLRFPLAHLGLHITAAHYDHAMRASSAADAEWVRGLCRAWGVSLVRGRARRVLASEAEARTARYRFLSGVRRAKGARFVLTAHHADDQIETVLFRIMRGTGLRGLGGMREVRGHLVRPLLSFHRDEIREYAHAARIGFREDATNTDVRFARNRLRHEVLPQLESVLPGASRELLQLAELARVHERAWKPLVNEAFGEVVQPLKNDVFELARVPLLAYHPEVGARVIRALARRLGCALDRAGTQAALQFISSASSGSVLQLGAGIELHRDFDRIRIERTEWRRGDAATRRRGEPETAPANSASNRTFLIEQAGSGSAETVLGGHSFRVSWTVGEDLRFPLELRAWRPGDRIRLPYGTKKLKKLFVEQRIARAERARVPLLVDADNRVLWVRGVARAAPVRPGDDAELQIMVSDAEYG
jgi:tRNA(Ile)-lysidine synthase